MDQYTISVLSTEFDVEKQLELQKKVIEKSGANFIIEKSGANLLKYRGEDGITFGAFDGNGILIGEAILYTKRLTEQAEKEQAENKGLIRCLWRKRF